jgi:branched-chain amino acid transport system substrate-binding protein
MLQAIRIRSPVLRPLHGLHGRYLRERREEGKVKLTRRQLGRIAAAMPLYACIAPRLAKAQDAGKIRVGVPLPITGAVADLGGQVKEGIELAVKEINQSGGLLGRQIELVVSDTKSEPNTAAAVAIKMITSDKVDVFVGGMGSTPDFAMLSAVRQYSPVFIEIGSGSDKIEQEFGANPWYFHVNPWDYYRQKGIELFVESLTPKVRRIAFVYEDGLNGTTSSKTAVEGFAGKCEIVVNEPFKSGTPDLSAILGRVKAADPDLMICNAYAPDYLLLRRQQQQLAAYPKMTLIFGGGQTPQDFGELGNNMASVDIWSPALNIPGVAQFADRVKAAGIRLRVFVVVGYAGMQTFAQGVKAAGSLDRDKLLNAFANQSFDTVFGPVRYQASLKGGAHQLLNQNNIVVVQYQSGQEQVVFPTRFASSKIVYPVNNSNQPV